MAQDENDIKNKGLIHSTRNIMATIIKRQAPKNVAYFSCLAEKKWIQLPMAAMSFGWGVSEFLQEKVKGDIRG
eukprot:CAMPEP_0116824476 /NCGR_PEP_ID=MMETSP0418-20121206/1418_1 /TAXON_ID=1158023 /ORGANISM="Astrosyne radiata, Strain 13vi08-1A" /LENGTH=72 /DNA_ID=CAMNT_0004452851 /DNA_START=911 /DNA_END=1129 /DNA_ORIENTATION=-